MSGRDLKPDKPIDELPTRLPELRGVRFREPITLGDLKPEMGINLDDPKNRHQVTVAGASVFIRAGDRIVEVPRAACVLFWSHPADGLSEAVRALTGKGSK